VKCIDCKVRGVRPGGYQLAPVVREEGALSRPLMLLLLLLFTYYVALLLDEKYVQI